MSRQNIERLRIKDAAIPQSLRLRRWLLQIGVGVTEAARQLKLRSSQLYAWQSQIKSDQQKDAISKTLTTENTRLKRQLANKIKSLK